MNDPIVLVLTRGVYILIFGLTLLDFLRRRDIPRLEVAALHLHLDRRNRVNNNTHEALHGHVAQ